MKAIAFGLKSIEEIIVKLKLKNAMSMLKGQSSGIDVLRQFISTNIDLITEVTSVSCE